MQESFYGKPSSDIFITTIYSTLNDLNDDLSNLLVNQYFVVNDDYNEVLNIEVGVTPVNNYYTRTGTSGNYTYLPASGLAESGITYYAKGNAGIYKIVLVGVTKTALKITQFVGASGTIRFLGYFDELPSILTSIAGDACFIKEPDALSGTYLYNFYFYDGEEWKRNNLFSEKIDDNIISDSKTFSSDKITEYFLDNGLNKRHEDDILSNIIIDDGYYKLSPGLTKNKLELILFNLTDKDLFKIKYIPSNVTEVTWVSKITNGLYLLSDNIYSRITDLTLEYDSTVTYYEIELKDSGLIKYYKYILEFAKSTYYTLAAGVYTLDALDYDENKTYYYIKEINLIEEDYLISNYFIRDGANYILATAEFDPAETYYDIFEVILFSSDNFDYDLTNGLFIKYKNYHIVGKNREYLYGHNHGNISHNGYFLREDVEQKNIPFSPVITNKNSEIDYCSPEEFNSLIGEIFISDQSKIVIDDLNSEIRVTLDEGITFNTISGALVKIFFAAGVNTQKPIVLKIYNSDNIELATGNIKYDNRTGIFDAEKGTFKFDSNFIPTGHVAVFVFRETDSENFFELLNPMYIGTHNHYIKSINDIEYGTWLPILTDGGSKDSSIKDSAIVSSHLTDPIGWYQRIGNLVTIGFNLHFIPNANISNEDNSQTISLGSIPIGIQGLPYNCIENAGGGGVIYNTFIGSTDTKTVSSADEALNVLVSYGIVQTKQYWTDTLAAGTIQYLDLLLKNTANYLLKTSKYPSCFYLKAKGTTPANDDNVVGVRLTSVNSDNTCNLSYGYYNNVNKNIKLIGTLTYFTNDDFGTYISDNVIVTDPATAAEISEIKNLITAMDELINSANEQLQLS